MSRRVTKGVPAGCRRRRRGTWRCWRARARARASASWRGWRRCACAACWRAWRRATWRRCPRCAPPWASRSTTSVTARTPTQLLHNRLSGCTRSSELSPQFFSQFFHYKTDFLTMVLGCVWSISVRRCLFKIKNTDRPARLRLRSLG